VPGHWLAVARGKQEGASAGPAAEPLLESLRAAPQVDWAHEALRTRGTRELLLPTRRVVVKLRAGAPADFADRLPGTRLLRPLRLARDQFLLELVDPAEHPCAAAERLRALPEVEWSEPDFVQSLEPLSTPDDPLFGEQWHLENTGQGGGVPGADARLPGAWDFEVGGGGVVIAVIDTGVQSSHPDLAGRMFTNTLEPLDGVDNDGNGYLDDRFGWDFLDDDNDANPALATGADSHGTAVAGVAAAATDNGIGVAGACQGCRILSVRIGSGSAFAISSALAEAILYAGSFARILNNSWRTPPAAVITDALAEVAAEGSGGLGTPVVGGTGNSATGYFWYWFDGLAAATYTFEWVYQKDGSVSAGFDRTWLDSVLFPGGEEELFDGCGGLPPGWSSSGPAWTAVADETRSGSFSEDSCAIVSGAIGHSQLSAVRTTRELSVGGRLWYQVWVSAEKNAPMGEGPQVIDDRQGAPECYDFTYLNIFDASETLVFQGNFSCGTWSSAGPLEDGVLAFPASHPDTIAVGASTDGDRRADYSQWGPELELVAPSGGGRVGITSTDLAGSSGYTPSDYTEGLLIGTSLASPLVAGILGLLLTDQPALELAEVRERLRHATRKIGGLPYVGGRNDHYGWGVLSAERLLTNLLIDDFESGNLTAWSNH
jgi:subtilisin family serine protease